MKNKVGTCSFFVTRLFGLSVSDNINGFSLFLEFLLLFKYLFWWIFYNRRFPLNCKWFVIHVYTFLFLFILRWFIALLSLHLLFDLNDFTFLCNHIVNFIVFVNTLFSFVEDKVSPLSAERARGIHILTLLSNNLFNIEKALKLLVSYVLHFIVFKYVLKCLFKTAWFYTNSIKQFKLLAESSETNFLCFEGIKLLEYCSRPTSLADLIGNQHK